MIPSSVIDGKMSMMLVCDLYHLASPKACDIEAYNVLATAVWDNRTVYHSAIFDYAGLGVRTGHRAVGIGEQPYFDPNSLTRREALAKEADGGWEDY